MPARPLFSFFVAIAFAGIIAVGLPTAANAAPNCGQVPAPPACGSAPKPKPAPAPTGFSTARFTPDFSDQNRFVLVIQNVPEAAVVGLADTQVSTYRAAISCTNGFFYSGQLARSGVYAPTLSLRADVPANSFGAGSCIATTWDASALAVIGSRVSKENIMVAPFGASWSIVFD